MESHQTSSLLKVLVTHKDSINICNFLSDCLQKVALHLIS